MAAASALPNENRYLGELGPKLYMRLGGLGFLLIAGSYGLSKLMGDDSARFWRAYLVAYFFVLSICLGALFFTILQHLTRAGWSVVVRRISEGLVANLKWIWIGFIPIIVLVWTGNAHELYHWTVGADALPEGSPEQAMLEYKDAYLNPMFWTLRAAAYFVIWFVLARFFVGNSIAQDTTGDAKTTTRMQTIAAPAMLLYAFTQSYAAIDWIMTLEYAWFSTMFGVYFFAASCCGFGATLILMVSFLQKTGRVTQSITTEHHQEMGKFLFAFGIIFWAYIGYSQYMLIWYANIPEETTWFMIRQLGSWKWLSYLIIFGHFFVPFIVLLSKHPKRFKIMLVSACLWLFAIHYVDMYWLTMPSIPMEMFAEATSYEALSIDFPDSQYAAEYDLSFQFFDLTLWLGFACLMFGGAAFALRNQALIPEHDPRLYESLAYENI